MLYVDFGVGSRQVAGQQDSRTAGQQDRTGSRAGITPHTYIHITFTMQQPDQVRIISDYVCSSRREPR